jgi:hypothetical protein
MYYHKNPLNGTIASGPDVDKSPEVGNLDDYNLQNYFNRIKSLNIAIQPLNE